MRKIKSFLNIMNKNANMNLNISIIVQDFVVNRFILIQTDWTLHLLLKPLSDLHIVRNKVDIIVFILPLLVQDKTEKSESS